jgi:hypothetical protein
MVEQTRYGRIRHLDLGDWRTWLDTVKDRYTEDGVGHGFWVTLDAKLVAATFRVPIIGSLARVVLAGIGPLLLVAALCAFGWYGLVAFPLAWLGTNRYEPYPVGNNARVNNLWADRPDWLRWVYWHLRNPLVDLRKFYLLGFGYAVEVNQSTHGWGRVHWARFAGLPLAIPFPEFRMGVRIGWKPQGILAAGINDLNEW